MKVEREKKERLVASRSRPRVLSNTEPGLGKIQDSRVSIEYDLFDIVLVRVEFGLEERKGKQDESGKKKTRKTCRRGS